MSTTESLVLAAAVTLVGLAVTAAWRALARAWRALIAHLAELGRLPESLDKLDATVSQLAADHDARITRLEKLVTA